MYALSGYEAFEIVRARPAGLERSESTTPFKRVGLRAGFDSARQEERVEGSNVLQAFPGGQVRIAAAFDAGSRAGGACCAWATAIAASSSADRIWDRWSCWVKRILA